MLLRVVLAISWEVFRYKAEVSIQGTLSSLSNLQILDSHHIPSCPSPKTLIKSQALTPLDQAVKVSDHRLVHAATPASNRLTTSNMTNSCRPSMDTQSEKDAISVKTTSTIRSTASLIRSLLPSERTKPSKPFRHTETPTKKAERKYIEAEARLAWALNR